MQHFSCSCAFVLWGLSLQDRYYDVVSFYMTYTVIRISKLCIYSIYLLAVFVGVFFIVMIVITTVIIVITEIIVSANVLLCLCTVVVVFSIMSTDIAVIVTVTAVAVFVFVLFDLLV
jgi:hypothetical protein